MIKKRINTDLFLSLSIKDAKGNDADMSSASNITLFIRNKKSMKRISHAFSIASNVVSLQYSVSENKEFGNYTVSVEWDEPDTRSATGIIHKAVDFENAFEIVESTEKEENVEVTISGIVYTFGAPGLSAYEIAVEKSYAGSESEWLASLKGSKGDAFEYSDFTDEEIAALQKPATDAAATVENAKQDAETAAGVAITAAKKAVDSAAACDDTNKSVTDAEASRVTAETSRVNAENARVSEFNTMKTNSENATTAANEAATKADTAASHAPKIVDGIWHTWDTGTQSYVSTGIKAAGADGITPQLRINSTTFNWELSIDGGLKWIDMNVAAKQATSSATVVQEIGTSTTDVMSQKAVTDALNGVTISDADFYKKLNGLNYVIYKTSDDVVHKLIYTYPSASTYIYTPWNSNTGKIIEIYAISNTSNQTSLYYAFVGNVNLTKIPLIDCTEIKSASSAFYQVGNLTDADGLYNLKIGINLSVVPKLTHDSLVSIISNLADMTLSANQTWATNNSLTTTPTLTLGSTNLAKLTDAEKKVATDKNWILA